MNRKGVAARRGLKEAEGKAVARGTRTAYEACERWARRPKDPKPDVTRIGRAEMRRVYAAKVTCLTPGDLSACHELPASQEVGKGGQKSAEAVVAACVRR